MLALLGMALPREDLTHAFLFFSVMLLGLMVLAGLGYSFAPALLVVLNRDQEQLRYWLDAAEQPGADRAACLMVAAVYWRRLGAGDVDRALRLRYKVATSRQHHEGDSGGR